MMPRIGRHAHQERSEIGAEKHRDEDRRANDRNGQQHLEGGGRHKLNRDDRPIRRGEERAALEEEFQMHTNGRNPDHCMLS